MHTINVDHIHKPDKGATVTNYCPQLTHNIMLTCIAYLQYVLQSSISGGA